MIGGISSGLFWPNTPFQSTPISSTPSAIAAPVIVGRWVMRPMISAASARTQEVERERRTDRQADHPGAEEQGEEGEHAGDRPHDRVQVLHRDAEQAGAIGSVGGRPDGHADGGALQEQPDAEDRDRRDHQHEEVVGVEHQRIDLEGEVERWVDALRPHLLAEQAREEAGLRTRAAG